MKDLQEKHYWSNKNSFWVFDLKRSVKKDILMCLDLIARAYGGELVDKN